MVNRRVVRHGKEDIYLHKGTINMEAGERSVSLRTVTRNDTQVRSRTSVKQWGQRPKSDG